MVSVTLFWSWLLALSRPDETCIILLWRMVDDFSCQGERSPKEKVKRRKTKFIYSGNWSWLRLKLLDSDTQKFPSSYANSIICAREQMPNIHWRLGSSPPSSDSQAPTCRTFEYDLGFFGVFFSGEQIYSGTILRLRQTYFLLTGEKNLHADVLRYAKLGNI